MLDRHPIPGNTSHINLPNQFNATNYFLDRHLFAGRGEHIAVYHEGNTYTYAQIAEMTNRVGNALLELGMEMEQRVALLLHDSPQFVATFFGAIKIGAVAVPLNTMLCPDDYLYMLNDGRIRVLVVHASLWLNIQSLRPKFTYLRHVVIVNDINRPLIEARDTQDFNCWTDRASTTLQTVMTSKDDSAFWLYSSGSTGTPKGCIHLHHDMVYCQNYGREILKINEQDITFSASKLYYAYGMGNNLHIPFAIGASALYFPHRPLPEDVFKVIERYRPTIFYAVPTLYANMLALPDIAKRFDVSSLRLCVSAGEALPANVLHNWRETFQIDILDGLGMTEVLYTFISNRPDDIRPGSTGKVVPGCAVRIVDEEGKDVVPGKMGNLLVKGESTITGYWNKHEKTKDTINGHWFQSGDQYFVDAEGYYWFCGRSDDMFKVSGQWVSPVEVERTLIKHSAVLEAAVVGVMDQNQLIKPKAYVVLRQGIVPSDELASELKEFVKLRIAPFKYPRYLEFLPQLPKTSTGKIQRFRLRDQDM